MKTVRVLGLLATLLGIVLIASCAWGQGNQASLEGTVLDQSGAVLAGVKLTATNTATGIRFVATSDSNGLFSFPVMPVGTYAIEAEHQGFTKLMQKDVQLTVGARLNLTLAMAVAGQSQSVTVTSETPILETTRSQVSSSVDDVVIENLPTNGRNFINFALLTPGVTLDIRGGDVSITGPRRAPTFLLRAGAGSTNNFFI